jgi:hypothetical protein
VNETGTKNTKPVNEATLRRLLESDRTSRLTGHRSDWLADPQWKAAAAMHKLSVFVTLIAVSFMLVMLAYHTGHLPPLGHWVESALGFVGTVLR